METELTAQPGQGVQTGSSELSDRNGRRASTFPRLGAVAGMAMAGLLLLLFGITASLSTSNPRTEAAQFLADVQDKLTLLKASPWVAAAFVLAVGPFFYALYTVFRRVSWHRSEVMMHLAVAGALFTMVLGSGLVVMEAAGAGHIVPAWSSAESEVQKEFLLHDFRALAWGMEAVSRMFDLTITAASIATSIVMIKTGMRWWKSVGWLGIVSGAIHLPGVVVLFFFEAFEPVHFVADLTFLLWAFATGLGLWIRAPRAVSTGR